MKTIHIVFAIFALLILAGCIIQPPALHNNQTSNTTGDAPAPKQKETAVNQTQTKGYDPSLPRKEVKEGEEVSFPNLKAVDPDGDPITYTFTSPLDKDGKWQTKVGDAGEYLVTITASDGTNTAKQDLIIAVKPANTPPTISIAQQYTFKEGETVTLTPEVADADKDKVTISYFGWMTSDTKTTTYKDAGSYKVTVQASDGKDTVKKEVTITIEDVNRKPALEKLEPINIKEGQELQVKPKATDADGDTITYKFAEPLDQNGHWRTKIGDAGEYSVTVTASDGKTTVKETQIITVEALNRPPTIDVAEEIKAKEGETINIQASVTDPDGDEFTVSYSGWMTGPTYTTGYEDSGTHKVTITAEDTGGHKREREITIIIEDVNRPPEFDAGSFI